MAVLALGFFDGVHVGHAALLRAARALADRLGCDAEAITFDTHPSALLSKTPQPLLGSVEDRRILMARFVDRVRVLPFNRETLHTPWQTFAAQVLADADGLVCGYDYRFGENGAGTAELLRQFAAARNIPCEVIPPVELDGGAVSSTRIRKLLQDGETAQAVHLLGHPHLISGTVSHGQQLGHTLGFPTANLPFTSGILVPAYGVYAAKAETAEGTFDAVCNVGTHPTVGALDTAQAEAWLLDFDGDLYGQPLRLWIYDRLREERAFPDLASLKAEILRNAEQVRELAKRFSF